MSYKRHCIYEDSCPNLVEKKDCIVNSYSDGFLGSSNTQIKFFVLNYEIVVDHPCICFKRLCATESYQPHSMQMYARDPDGFFDLETQCCY